MTTSDERARGRAYKLSGSDADAADRLGVSIAAFRQWRIARGLQSKRAKGRPLEAATEEARLRAYRTTDSDVEAAAALSMGLDAFRAWRRTRGFKAKGRPARKVDFEKRRRVISATSTDAEAARKLKISRRAVAWWRRTRDLRHPK